MILASKRSEVMNTGIKLLLAACFVSALVANINAVAGNWNSSSGAGAVEHGNKSSYRFIEAEGKIPLHQLHSLTPQNSEILLTDTKNYYHPHCEGSIKNNYKKYRFSSEALKKDFARLAVKDLNEVMDFSDGNGDDGGLSDKFSMTINKAHMACLSGDNVGCQSVMTAMEMLSAEAAFTANKKFGDTPVTYFVTVHRFLKPLLAAYSTASQRLGRHKKDMQFRNWMQQAIFQNTYNPFAPEGKRDRDLIREKPLKAKGPKFSFYGQDPAQNHSLQSGLVAMMYGVLWQNQHMYHVGLDSYLITLKSINNEGALPLEAIRGGSGMFYSGATLHTLLQIYEIAKNQNQDLSIAYPETKSLHRAAAFLLDVVENEEIILKYARLNKTNSMCKTYSEQCFHNTNRDNAFGWVRLYMNNFPKHENTQRILSFYQELVDSRSIESRRKENLNAVIKGRFEHEPFRHNLTFNPEKWDKPDSYDFTSFPTDNNWSIGSPKCLYDKLPVTELKYSPSIRTDNLKLNTSKADACSDPVFAELMGQSCG